MKYNIGLENEYGSVTLEFVNGDWQMSLDCCISPVSTLRISESVAKELINSSSKECLTYNLQDYLPEGYDVVGLHQEQFEVNKVDWNIEEEDYFTVKVFEASSKYNLICELPKVLGK
jgi:hypothetical protein